MSSKNRGDKSLLQDKYYTPNYCIDLLIQRIDFTKVTTFLEPCCGDHRITNKIPNNITKYEAELDLGIDYLKTKFESIDLIITNPPFSLSIEFVKKSLQEGKTICYLQRINWLGSKSRKEFWNNSIPDKLFILSKRPQFMKEMGLKAGSDSTEYTWFIWDNLNIVNGKHIEIL